MRGLPDKRDVLVWVVPILRGYALWHRVPMQPYERNIFLFLSFYRFLAYGLAVILIQATGLEGTGGIPETHYALIVGIGIYTILKVLAPLRWRATRGMTYALLAGDVLVGMKAVLLSGGIESAFLLYSLTPILTAALLFERRWALAVVAFTSGALTLPYLMFYRWDDQYVWIMTDGMAWWLAFFLAAKVATVSTLHGSNWNVRRGIQ